MATNAVDIERAEGETVADAKAKQQKEGAAAAPSPAAPAPQAAEGTEGSFLHRKVIGPLISVLKSGEI